MNSFGTNFKITIYGRSHSKTMGVIIDGIKPGIKIDESLIKADLDRRRPGAIGTTTRIEDDEFIIKSGILNGLTTGDEIHIEIPNKNVIAKDYENLKDHYRPSHADFVANLKYDKTNEYRGGGIFSGRLTALWVVAGAIAKQIIPAKISSELVKVSKLDNLDNLNQHLQKLTDDGDSAGAMIKVTATNMPKGLGDPPFRRLDGQIGMLFMSIPGVRVVSIGDGLDILNMLGSEFNDLIIDKDGKTLTNHSGGINGGISNGNDLIVYTIVRPTPSIKKEQQTFNFKTNKVEGLKINGRHDVCFGLRVGVVLESALAIILADFLN